MKNKSNKKIGNDFETKVQKTINSGALRFDKGDLKTEDYLIECKYTKKKGFRITQKILQKLWEQAYDSNKTPKMVIGIKDEDNDWILTVNVNKKRR